MRRKTGGDLVVTKRERQRGNGLLDAGFLTDDLGQRSGNGDLRRRCTFSGSGRQPGSAGPLVFIGPLSGTASGGVLSGPGLVPSRPPPPTQTPGGRSSLPGTDVGRWSQRVFGTRQPILCRTHCYLHVYHVADI